MRDLELRRFGYEVLPKDPAYFAPYLDGRHLFMYADQRRTLRGRSRSSRARDAERYPAYEALRSSASRGSSSRCCSQAPPNLPPRAPADLAALGRLGCAAAAHAAGRAGRAGAHVHGQRARNPRGLVRVGRAQAGAGHRRGDRHQRRARRRQGTAYVLLHHVMGGVGGVRGLWGFVRGGMGALSEALKRSAQAAGAEIRTDAEVAQRRRARRPRRRRGAGRRHRVPGPRGRLERRPEAHVPRPGRPRAPAA